MTSTRPPMRWETRSTEPSCPGGDPEAGHCFSGPWGPCSFKGLVEMVITHQGLRDLAGWLPQGGHKCARRGARWFPWAKASWCSSAADGAPWEADW
jgi:hypothetical protein